MFPFNNYLIIDVIEEKEENCFEGLIDIDHDKPKKFTKAKLIKYSKKSPNKDVWANSIKNVIYVHSAHIIEIMENGEKVYLVPESAAVCGYVNKDEWNRK